MTDGYRVRLARPAVRDFQRLPGKVADAVAAFLAGPLSENPQPTTKPLRGPLAGTRSGYVGISYRVLVQIDESARVVHVVRIAHRADAYRTGR